MKLFQKAKECLFPKVKLERDQIWRDTIDEKGYWDIRIISVRENSYDYQFVPRTGMKKGFSSDLHTASISLSPNRLSYYTLIIK